MFVYSIDIVYTCIERVCMGGCKAKLNTTTRPNFSNESYDICYVCYVYGTLMYQKYKYISLRYSDIQQKSYCLPG